MNDFKIGRNDLCPCGSGLKYKKCCLQKEPKVYEKKGVFFHKNIEKQKEDQNAIIMTTTNELYMAIRLYYQIYKLDELLVRLKEFQCIDWTTENRSFFINYNEEAKNIGLAVKYDAVPKDLFPVILAEGNIENKNELHLDLRSFERAVCLVKFIDKYIDRSILKVTHAATYNKIQSADKENPKKAWNLDYDELFSGNNMKIIDPDEELSRLESLTANIQNPADKLVAFENEYKNKKMPLIEKFPVNYYEDGIQSFDTTLKIKMALAYANSKGNEETTPYEFIKKVVSGVAPAKIFR